jgi:aminopeptidase N
MKKLVFIFSLFFANLLLAQYPQVSYKDCPSCRAYKEAAHRSWGQKRLNVNYNSRSDSFDIINYNIDIQEVNYTNSSLRAVCTVQMRAKMAGINKINFDLLRLVTDSVKIGSTLLTYSTNDSMVLVNFPATNLNDTLNISFYYRGQPRTDASWGGFYFQGSYAYNLGVGFSSDPHNFGRVWHPCFDNFVERATYQVSVSTMGSKRGHSNGLMSSEITQNGQTTRVWQLTTAIPSYLACIAVADYTTVRQSYAGLNGNIPIELAAEAGDTAALKVAFQNLPSALSAYERWFGAYRWQKVGYSLVPFNAGAMEHATNIAYPKYTLTNPAQYERYETLMAHELSHHWWGDWVTCETAEDMWINEGMASYCEHLFLEELHGRERYTSTVKSNHYDVLQNAHTAEGGYRAVSGVPHQYTYGQHVYNKGASVAHNLRWYMGDSLFKVGTRAVMDNYALTDVNSTELRDALMVATGVDLVPFFDNWVFEGGFPHFEVDSTIYIAQGNGYLATIFVKQKLVGANVFHTAVPLQLSFYDGWQKYQTKGYFSGENSSITLTIPFLPSLVILNEEHRLNQARFDFANTYRAISTSQNLGSTQIAAFQITNLVDSAYIQAQYHPVAPNPIRQNTNNYRISTRRFWSLQGVWAMGTNASFRFEPSNSLDSDLMQNGADSLMLLYKENPNSEWIEHPDYTKVSVSGFIYLRPNILLAGDYAFANGEMGLGVDKTERSKLKNSMIFPNPAENTVNLQIQLKKRASLQIIIINSAGQIFDIKKINLSAGKNTESLDISNLAVGLYFIKIQDTEGQTLHTHQLIKAQ